MLDIEKRRAHAAGLVGYPAGKSSIVEQLTPLVPATKGYGEPFFGSGALFFSIEPRGLEVINDIDADVAGVYKALQKATGADLDAVRAMQWVGEESFYRNLLKATPSSTAEQIHKFLYLTRFGYGRHRKSWAGATQEGVTSQIPGRLEWARDRLAKAKISARDYREVLKEYDGPDMFWFLDPPYAGYNREVGEESFDEVAFRKCLDGLKGKFLLTYGTKGALDTSGFHVKKLAQERTLRFTRGTDPSNDTITHLLVSNYEIAQKSIEGWTMEDVEAIVDEAGDNVRVFMSAGASVSPEAAAGAGAAVDGERIVYVPMTEVDAFAWYEPVLKQQSAREALLVVGPPDEWSGAVASLMSAELRAELKEAWEALDEDEKDKIRAAFLRTFEDGSRADPPPPPGVAKAEASASDREQGLQALLSSVFEPRMPGGGCPAYVVDTYDDAFVFSHDGLLFMAPYRNEGGIFSIAGEPARVRRTYEPIEAPAPSPATPGDLELAAKIDRAVEKGWSGWSTICKAAAPADERFVLGIVLEPEVTDAQQDIYSHEEVRQAAHKWMSDYQRLGFMHRKMIGGGAGIVGKADAGGIDPRRAVIVESYIAPVDFEMGGQQVKAGTWLLAQKIIDDELWKLIKGGDVTGLSIGGSAKRTPTGKRDAADTVKKVNFNGLEVHIDRPAGYVQRGTDESGKAWERTYKVDYGDIEGTDGGDGEGIDVFIASKSGPDAHWCVQKKADGTFDEYKVVLGAESQAAARKVYVEHIPERFLASMFVTSVETIKALRGVAPAEVLKLIEKMQRQAK